MAFYIRIANGTTSTHILTLCLSHTHTHASSVLTHGEDEGIDAGDEHTICHDELTVASIINFTWHMR